MDVVTYALLKKSAGQGSYTSVSDLPSNAKAGATAVVNGDLYYFNGTDWTHLNEDVVTGITNSEIDELWP